MWIFHKKWAKAISIWILLYAGHEGKLLDMHIYMLLNKMKTQRALRINHWNNASMVQHLRPSIRKCESRLTLRNPSSENQWNEELDITAMMMLTIVLTEWITENHNTIYRHKGGCKSKGFISVTTKEMISSMNQQSTSHCNRDVKQESGAGYYRSSKPNSHGIRQRLRQLQMTMNYVVTTEQPLTTGQL